MPEPDLTGGRAITEGPARSELITVNRGVPDSVRWHVERSSTNSPVSAHCSTEASEASALCPPSGLATRATQRPPGCLSLSCTASILANSKNEAKQLMLCWRSKWHSSGSSLFAVSRTRRFGVTAQACLGRVGPNLQSALLLYLCNATLHMFFGQPEAWLPEILSAPVLERMECLLVGASDPCTSDTEVRGTKPELLLNVSPPAFTGHCRDITERAACSFTHSACFEPMMFAFVV